MTPSRRGYSIVHMLVVMSLLGIFMAIAGHLFITCVRVTRAAGHAVTEDTVMQNALHYLRLDAWSAGEITVVSESEVKLATADGHGAVWTVMPTGELQRRRLGAEEINQQWAMPFDSMRFTREGSALLLRLESKTSTQVIPFASEPLRTRDLEKALADAGATR